MMDGQPIPEAALEVVEAESTRRVERVTESPFLIGRGAEAGNHLQLADRSISRRCAQLIYVDGVFRLEDRGQRQGVFVNGEKIDVRPLRDADVITFGQLDVVRLTFRAGPSQESLPQLLTRLGKAATMEEGGSRDLRQLSLLLEATALLQSHLPLEQVLGAMVDRAITITNAERAVLLEATPEADLRPLLARQQGGKSLPVGSMAPSQTALAQARQQRRSVVEEDIARADTVLRDARSVVAQQLRSVVAMPLHARAQARAGDATSGDTPGELLGVLYLDSRRPAAFSRLERQILDALAQEAASVLDNARLVQKEQERQRLERELGIAREIQQALLPKSFQEVRFCQVTGINRTCFEVGGDYFDLMEIGADRTGFVIADVSGKGLGAALETAMLQGSLSALTLGQEPAGVFAHVNRYLYAHSKAQDYATLFFGILGAGGRMEYINAGHHSPLLVRAGKVEAPFTEGTLPVGLLPEAEFKTASYALQPGDTLVLFTDGITEAMNEQQEEFGSQRLQEVVARNAGATVEKLQAAILAAVADFTRGALQGDDITVLILRYLGTAKPGSDTSI